MCLCQNVRGVLPPRVSMSGIMLACFNRKRQSAARLLQVWLTLWVSIRLAYLADNPSSAQDESQPDLALRLPHSAPLGALLRARNSASTNLADPPIFLPEAEFRAPLLDWRYARSTLSRDVRFPLFFPTSFQRPPPTPLS